MYLARALTHTDHSDYELPASASSITTTDTEAESPAIGTNSVQQRNVNFATNLATNLATNSATPVISTYSSKAANMSNQMAHILQAMPSGVVILDGDGVVTLANPVATELLGRPLQGARWFDIIHRAFAPQDDDGHEVSLKNGRRVKLAITPLAPEPGQLIVLTDLTETRLLQKNLSIPVS